MDKSRALETLLRVTRHLNLDPPLDHALRVVTDASLELLDGAGHASIRVLDEARTQLLSGARSGAGEDHRPVTFRPGEGLAGWVVQHGESARVADANHDERFVAKPGQGFSIRSILAVPIWSAQDVVGVLAAMAEAPDQFDADDELLLLLIANCAAPCMAKARLRRLMVTDEQTRAFNVRHLLPCLTQHVDRAANHGSPLSVLLMDLDYFKRVNDAYLHAAGDEVLQIFADRVRANVRQNDVFIRRGGEEFVLVMPGAPLGAAMRVAERIRKSMANDPVRLSAGMSFYQTVSVGVAVWSTGETAEQLEARADQAMYAAKSAGRDCVKLADPAT